MGIERRESQLPELNLQTDSLRQGDGGVFSFITWLHPYLSSSSTSRPTSAPQLSKAFWERDMDGDVIMNAVIVASDFVNFADQLLTPHGSL